MRIQLLQSVPTALSLSSVGFHYTSNVTYVYSIFGLNIHLFGFAIPMMGVYAFIILRELGRVHIEGVWRNFTLSVIDALLQGMVLVPFFVTPKGGLVNLADADGRFWLHVLLVAGSILLFRFVVDLFSHCKFIDPKNKQEDEKQEDAETHREELQA